MRVAGHKASGTLQRAGNPTDLTSDGKRRLRKIFTGLFEKGKVKEGWLDWDSSLTMMMQLGMELKPKEVKK